MVRREAQSLKDKELLQERRTAAVEAADAGDFAALLALGKRGDVKFAEQELARRGASYEAGELTIERTRAEEQAAQHEAMASQTAATLIPHFDAAVLEPLLRAASEEVQQRLINAGIEGLEGRTKAVETVVADIRERAAQDATTRALSDESFVKSLLKTEGFRKALITDPVANKQLRAYFRGELDDPPDLNAGVGASRTETDADFLTAYAAGDSNDHARAKKLLKARSGR